VSSLGWELDINDLELNRTHWAIKDVDLLEVLREAGLADAELSAPEAVSESPSDRRAQELLVTPSVFAVPDTPQDPALIGVMMPFSAAFDPVYRAICEAGQRAGFNCQRADDDEIWENSTIIQDVFDLIYRSAVIVVDLSGRNSNVMYETGIAHTLGRPVIPIAQSAEGVPFDLAHHRVLTYLPNSQGLALLTEKLAGKLRRSKV
jgi:hypothetical protein